MTDNEIIKALECCSGIARCVECPYAKIEDCAKRNTIDAKELINRQKAEIERLTLLANAFASTVVQGVEREDDIRAEAVKEFAERIKREFTDDCMGWVEIEEDVFCDVVDKLVKEFTEGSGNDGRG